MAAMEASINAHVQTGGRGRWYKLHSCPYNNADLVSLPRQARAHALHVFVSLVAVSVFERVHATHAPPPQTFI